MEIASSYSDERLSAERASNTAKLAGALALAVIFGLMCASPIISQGPTDTALAAFAFGMVLVAMLLIWFYMEVRFRSRLWNLDETFKDIRRNLFTDRSYKLCKTTLEKSQGRSAVEFHFKGGAYDFRYMVVVPFPVVLDFLYPLRDRFPDFIVREITKLHSSQSGKAVSPDYNDEMRFLNKLLDEQTSFFLNSSKALLDVDNVLVRGPVIRLRG